MEAKKLPTKLNSIRLATVHQYLK